MNCNDHKVYNNMKSVLLSEIIICKYFCCEILTAIKAWINNHIHCVLLGIITHQWPVFNHIHYTLLGVLTHPRPNFDGNFPKSTLKLNMKTSSNGNFFCVTGPLCGEFTRHRWIPLTKASDAELWCFLWLAPWINDWVNNRAAGDLRHHRAHYDVIVMNIDE